MDMSYAVGVLAMEHIAAGLVQGYRLTGPIRTWPRDAVRAGALQGVPADQISEAIRTLVDEVRDGAALDGIGVGFPGIVRAGIAEESPNLPQMKGYLLERSLSSALGQPVHVLNDADAAGLAEMRYGAGKGRGGVVVMITLGTGIGCALFLDGQLVPNTELGHIEMGGKDAETIAAASVRDRKGLSWKKYAERVQSYLKALDALIWPDLIIIGGGVSKTPEKFLPLIDVRPEVVPAALQNEAGIVGAALAASKVTP